MPSYCVVRVNDEPTSTRVIECLLKNESGVSDLPTMTTAGSDGEPPCMCGSVAYTGDQSSVYMLGFDNVWHKI